MPSAQDAIHKMCREIRVSFTQNFIALQVEEASKCGAQSAKRSSERLKEAQRATIGLEALPFLGGIFGPAASAERRAVAERAWARSIRLCLRCCLRLTCRAACHRCRV